MDQGSHTYPGASAPEVPKVSPQFIRNQRRDGTEFYNLGTSASTGAFNRMYSTNVATDRVQSSTNSLGHSRDRGEKKKKRRDQKQSRKKFGKQAEAEQEERRERRRRRHFLKQQRAALLIQYVFRRWRRRRKRRMEKAWQRTLLIVKVQSKWRRFAAKKKAERMQELVSALKRNTNHKS
jgi:hypothetical protein